MFPNLRWRAPNTAALRLTALLSIEGLLNSFFEPEEVPKALSKGSAYARQLRWVGDYLSN